MIDLYPIALADKLTGPYLDKAPTWASLVKNLTKPRVLPKAATPVFVPAELEGSRRAIEFVKKVTLLVFDIDNKNAINQITSEALRDRLMEQKLDSIVYSTASHTLHHPRYRLVIRISEPLVKADYRSFAEAVVKLLEIGPFIDWVCMEPSRCYYLPSCEASNVSIFESCSTYG